MTVSGSVNNSGIYTNAKIKLAFQGPGAYCIGVDTKKRKAPNYITVIGGSSNPQVNEYLSDE
jgi:hypothetical protein